MCLSSPKVPKIEPPKVAPPPPPPVAPERPQAAPVTQAQRRSARPKRNRLTISSPTGTNANSTGSGVSVPS